VEFDEHGSGDDQQCGAGDGGSGGQYDDSSNFGIDHGLHRPDGDGTDADFNHGDASEYFDSSGHDAAVHGDGNL
jgi:hypothetical protein